MIKQKMKLPEKCYDYASLTTSYFLAPGLQKSLHARYIPVFMRSLHILNCGNVDFCRIKNEDSQLNQISISHLLNGPSGMSNIRSN